MAQKMTALDGKEWTSSEEDNSASSSEDELHELHIFLDLKKKI